MWWFLLLGCPKTALLPPPAGLVIDGVIEPAWHGGRVAGPDATVAFVYCGHDGLYVAAEMDDPDLRAAVLEPDGRTWNDDVFELFVETRTTSGYYELEITPNNTVLDIVIREPRPDAYVAYATADPSSVQSAVALRGTLNDDLPDEGWAVEAFVPWVDLAAVMPRGPDSRRITFHLARYDYRAGEAARLSSSAPLQELNFHRRDDWIRTRCAPHRPDPT